MAARDIIVVGASAGGLDPLKEIVKQLPGDLPAAMFIVRHNAPDAPGRLAAILDDESALSVRTAETGKAIEHGWVYVAPPDHHMELKEGRITLTRGPRENRARPAVDPLFRSAAAYGARVIGVVLSGDLDDGTAGLLAVKERGGVAVVQDPGEAAYSSMPQSAIDYVEVDYRLPIREMAPCWSDLCRSPYPRRPSPRPRQIREHRREAT